VNKRRDDARDALKKLAATLSAKDKKVVSAKKELEGAENVVLDAQAAYNLKLREGTKLDLTEVKRMITTVKEAQAMLAKFKAYNNSFKMPSAK
jgi:predicted  nucleic acid-binding Zn-ribbon protein